MLNTILTVLLPFIIVLGAAVVIHEFGHFAVAKLLKMRVETFSVGFGKRLFGFRRGDTDYRVSLVPLGGYVKLGGDESNASVEGASASDIPAHERFDLRPRWQKFLVIIAGPVMNILTALSVMFFAALINGVPVPPSPVVRSMTQNGAAERAGLRPGDRIVAFRGIENPSWDRMRNDALLAPEQPLPITVEREGQRIDLMIPPVRRVRGDEPVGEFDFSLDYGESPVVIVEVAEGGPAAEAGVRAEDRLLAINNEPMRDATQVTEYIQAHRDEPLRFTLSRGNERVEIDLGTRRMEGNRIGIVPATSVPFERIGVLGAARYAVERNIEILRLTGNALGQVFSGQRAARDTIAGPIGIARATSNAVNQLGWWTGIVSMLGFLSLSLGVVNLLPIPVLDGGAIMILAIEGLLGLVGLNLSMAVRERIQQVGFVVLILLMGFAITNDLLKVASRWRSPTSENPPAATSSP